MKASTLWVRVIALSLVGCGSAAPTPPDGGGARGGGGAAAAGAGGTAGLASAGGMGGMAGSAGAAGTTPWGGAAGGAMAGQGGGAAGAAGSGATGGAGGIAGSGGQAGGPGGSGGTTGDLYEVCGELGWSGPTAVGFSPDGATIALAGAGIKLLDSTTGAVKRTLIGISPAVISLAFSPDGSSLVATGFDGFDTSNRPAVVMWRVADGSVVWTRPAADGILAVAFSPDGQLVALASHDKTVTLAIAATGQAARVYAEHQAPVGGVVFSPDGSLVASSDQSGAVKIWRTTDLATQRTLQGTAPIYSMAAAFSGDGSQLLSAALGQRVNVQDGSSLQSVPKNGPAAFAPDGQSFLAGGTLFRARDGASLRALPSGTAPAAYRPDSSSILIAGAPSYLWSILDGSTGKTYPLDSLESGLAVISPDGSRAFVGHQMFSLPDGAFLYRSSTVGTGTRSAAFSPDGSLVAATTDDGHLLVMNAADGSLRGSVAAHTGIVRAVAFSPAGDEVATGADDHLVKLWATADLSPLRTLGGIEGHTAGVTNVTWSSDGRWLASVAAEAIVWDATSGTAKQVVNTWGVPLLSSDDATLMLFQTDVMQSFDVASGAALGVLDIPVGSVPLVGRPFAPAGDLVAGDGYPEGVDVWALPTGRHVAWVPAQGAVQAFWVPNGLVTSGNGSVTTWCRAPDAGGASGGTEPLAAICTGSGSFTADFDGDTVEDCVVTSGTDLDFYKGVDGVVVQSTPIVSPSVLPSDAKWVTVADLNGDRREDLVYVELASDTYQASLLAGRSDGLFRRSPDLPALIKTSLSRGPVVGDFLGGAGDTVLFAGFDPTSLGQNNDAQWVLLSGTRTTTSLRVTTDFILRTGAQGSIKSLDASDLNGDGHSDVQMTADVRYLSGPSPGLTTVTKYGHGDGTFTDTP